MNVLDLLKTHVAWRSGYAYLASPFTQHPAGKEAACADACHAAGWLMDRAGVPAFSPIAHTHTIHVRYGNVASDTHEFWLRQDEPLVRSAASVVVLAIPGWDVSYGIAAELGFAADAGIDAYLMLPIDTASEGRSYRFETRAPIGLRRLIERRREGWGITT